MKKNLVIVLLMTVIIGVYSCGKSSTAPKTTTPTTADLLTAHAWNLTDSKYTGASWNFDPTPLSIPTYTFKTNGHYTVINPGFTNSPADTINGTWSLTDNNKTLKMDYTQGQTNSDGSWTINSITSSQFVLSVPVTLTYNNVTYTSEIITYTSAGN